LTKRNEKKEGEKKRKYITYLIDVRLLFFLFCVVKNYHFILFFLLKNKLNFYSTKAHKTIYSYHIIRRFVAKVKVSEFEVEI
jgi:hypothetical protein